MADKTPIKAIYDGSDVVALGEYAQGDSVPVENGGSGATNPTDAKINLEIIVSETGGIIIPIYPGGDSPLPPVEADSPLREGLIRFNAGSLQFEGYNGIFWGAIGGGATGALGDQVFVENDQIVMNDYTITAGKNAMTTGPITIGDGVFVTIPDGSVWTVI